MIVPSRGARRGLGRPYWELEGGYVPIERVARENRAARPSESTIGRVQRQRMAEITRGAVRNYSGAALRRGMRGLGDSPDLDPGMSAQPSEGYGQQLLDIFKAAVPAGMQTLQAVVAQPGQVIRTPTTLITGANTNVASIPGLSTASNSGLLIIGAVVIVGGLLIFGHKR